MSAKMRFNADLAKWLPERPVSPELDRWLAGDDSLCRCVKHNSKRRVYSLLPAPGAAPTCYLKHDAPNQLWDIVRSWIRPKVQREFSALELLHAHGVAAVAPLACGWARGQGVLLTRALAGSLTVDVLWPQVRQDKVRKSRLLAGLSMLLRDMLQNHIYHPDLHFGNILAVEGEHTTLCALVDVHGVRVTRNLSQTNQTLLLRLLAGVAQDLEQEEVQSLLQPLFPEAGPERLEDIWQRVELSMVRQMRRKWSGRRYKFLNPSSFCGMSNDREGKWMWRNGFDPDLACQAVQLHQQVISGSPALFRKSRKLNVSRVEAAGREFIVKEFPRQGHGRQYFADCRSWLTNWRLEMFGFPVPEYLAWLRVGDESGYLVIECLNGVSLDVALSGAADNEAERKLLLERLFKLLTHLYTWGIVHADLNTRNIIVCSEQGQPRLYLADNDEVLFDQRIRESHWQRLFQCLAGTMPDVPGLSQEFARVFDEAMARWRLAASR